MGVFLIYTISPQSEYNVCFCWCKTSNQVLWSAHISLGQTTEKNCLDGFNENILLAQNFLKRSSFLMENSPGFLEKILKVGEVLFSFISVVLPKKMLAVFFTEEWKEVLIICFHQSMDTFSNLFFFITLRQVLFL